MVASAEFPGTATATAWAASRSAPAAAAAPHAPRQAAGSVPAEVAGSAEPLLLMASVPAATLSVPPLQMARRVLLIAMALVASHRERPLSQMLAAAQLP